MDLYVPCSRPGNVKNRPSFIMVLTSSISPTGFPGGSAVKNPPAMQELQETWVQSLGQKDPLKEGIALQCSCLKDPMVRGAWQATVHRVAKSQT